MIDKLGIPWHIIIKLSLVLGLDCKCKKIHVTETKVMIVSVYMVICKKQYNFYIWLAY
ncbi:hypothetical protein BDE02_11G083600 [Populus trichocarpa]|nr:hypothetical protein BDE02_11G083600 [Populus trichocarpa]